MNTTTDRIARPSHYTQHPSGLECIEIARLLPGALSHAITYIWRAGLKIDREALETASEQLPGESAQVLETIDRAAAHYSAALDLQKAAYWVRDYIANYQPVLYPGRVAARLVKAANAEQNDHRRVALTALELLMHVHDTERHVLAHELVEKLNEWISFESAEAARIVGVSEKP